MIFIRLHPTLNKKEALRSLKEINEIPENVKYEFIDHKEESLSESIDYSLYCIFGQSSYFNLALELKAKTLLLIL